MLVKKISFVRPTLLFTSFTNEVTRMGRRKLRGEVDTAVFNQLQVEHTEYLKELDELDNS